MKKIVLLLVCVMTLASCSESFNAARALNGGMMAAQAMSISDAQVQSYVHQYITQLDAQSKVCGPSDPYRPYAWPCRILLYRRRSPRGEYSLSFLCS